MPGGLPLIGCNVQSLTSAHTTQRSSTSHCFKPWLLFLHAAGHVSQNSKDLEAHMLHLIPSRTVNHAMRALGHLPSSSPTAHMRFVRHGHVVVMGGLNQDAPPVPSLVQAFKCVKRLLWA